MYKHLFKVHTKLCAIAAAVACLFGMFFDAGFFFALMVFFWWAAVCAIFFLLSLFFPE